MLLYRPSAPTPPLKSSISLTHPRTLGEIPGTPESHAQTLAHAGMGEFARPESLRRSASAHPEDLLEGVSDEEVEMEMEPLWPKEGMALATGTDSCAV